MTIMRTRMSAQTMSCFYYFLAVSDISRKNFDFSRSLLVLPKVLL